MQTLIVRLLKTHFLRLMSTEWNWVSDQTCDSALPNRYNVQVSCCGCRPPWRVRVLKKRSGQQSCHTHDCWPIGFKVCSVSPCTTGHPTEDHLAVWLVSVWQCGEPRSPCPLEEAGIKHRHPWTCQFTGSLFCVPLKDILYTQLWAALNKSFFLFWSLKNRNTNNMPWCAPLFGSCVRKCR